MTRPAFRLGLLGPWRLTADGEAIHLRSREQRVVARLALRNFFTRSELAALLWPNSTPRQSYGSLRAAVFNLRREAPGLVVTEADTVALAEGVSTDVGDLIRNAERARTAVVDDTAEEIITGLDTPELLTGWYEDWVEEEREALRTLRLESLIGLAQRCLDQDRPEIAQVAAEAALVVEPLHEPSCELLVRAHLALTEHLDAVREFERFRKRLVAEVGLQPSERLHDLAYGGAGEYEPRRLRLVGGGPSHQLGINRSQGV